MYSSGVRGKNSHQVEKNVFEFCEANTFAVNYVVKKSKPRISACFSYSRNNGLKTIKKTFNHDLVLLTITFSFFTNKYKDKYKTLTQEWGRHDFIKNFWIHLKRKRIFCMLLLILKQISSLELWAHNVELT